MLVLAFDTATAAVTVALHDGSGVLATETVADTRRHAELLVPAIGAVLRGAKATRRDITDITDITNIAVGVGPGPFTGLRVGLVTARSLGYALRLPAHGACTLDVLAWEYASGRRDRGGGSFVVATDARRREVYWAAYDAAYDGTGDRVDGPAVARPHDVPGAAHRPTVGQGAILYPDAFPDARPPIHPSAAALADLTVARLRSGRGLEPAEPMYLRRPDARAPGPRKQVGPA